MKKIAFLSFFVIILTGCSMNEVKKGSYTTEDGETIEVTYTEIDGDITDTQFSVTTADGQDKDKLVAEGSYNMESELTWSEQVDSLEETIDAIDEFPELNEAGYDVDGITSATIYLKEFEEAFNNAK